MKIKELISLVLSIVAISAMMASCSSENRTSISIGNYTVEEVTIPENYDTTDSENYDTTDSKDTSEPTRIEKLK